MKKTLKLMATLFVGAMFMGACQQAEEPAVEQGQPDAVVTHRNGCRGIEFLKNTLGKVHFGQPLVRGFLRCDTRKDTGHHIGKVLH